MATSSVTYDGVMQQTRPINNNANGTSSSWVTFFVIAVIIALGVWLISRGSNTTTVSSSVSPSSDLNTNSQVQSNMPVVSVSTQPQVSGTSHY